MEPAAPPWSERDSKGWDEPSRLVLTWHPGQDPTTAQELEVRFEKIAALNWLRAGRPGDRALAFWALTGALAWAALMVWLAFAANMLADPRPWLFVAVALVLSVFSARDLLALRRE